MEFNSTFKELIYCAEAYIYKENHRNSVEIKTRFNFVIEFITPKFIEGSTCFERHTAHHQEL
jgi:hypothetical protein